MGCRFATGQFGTVSTDTTQKNKAHPRQTNHNPGRFTWRVLRVITACSPATEHLIKWLFIDVKTQHDFNENCVFSASCTTLKKRRGGNAMKPNTCCYVPKWRIVVLHYGPQWSITVQWIILYLKKINAFSTWWIVSCKKHCFTSWFLEPCMWAKGDKSDAISEGGSDTWLLVLSLTRVR